MSRRNLKIFFLMKTERSVEWVDLILVPLSDKFDIKCLFDVVFFFYSLRTNLEFVSTLMEPISYVVCNLKTKEHSNKQLNYILEL